MKILTTRLRRKSLQRILITLMASYVTQVVADDSRVIRIATFNVSMEGSNYVADGTRPTGNELAGALNSGNHPQIRNIAEIIQRVRPDILLLNEFDYHPDPKRHVIPFFNNYLSHSAPGIEAIEYSYFYQGPVNTGVDSGLDLDGDGKASGTGGDAFGYGDYPGQYGMVLLSRFPIDAEAARQFQTFRWIDMPGNLLTGMIEPSGEPSYSEEAQEIARLSSKSHWDVPIKIDDRIVHVLASHPTPPVFDGPEDRNGRRNHDEIRFWTDYLSGADYIYDDAGKSGAFSGDQFVLLGDLNASTVEGDGRREAITSLLGHSKVMRDVRPTSEGGLANNPGSSFSSSHTASWRMRADYVIPSRSGWRLVDSGVFWPTEDEPLYRLVESRSASSDHRLVWVDLELKD